MRLDFAPHQERRATLCVINDEEMTPSIYVQHKCYYYFAKQLTRPSKSLVTTRSLPAPQSTTTTTTAQMDLSMSMEDDDIIDLVPAGILHDFRDTVRIKLSLDSTGH